MARVKDGVPCLLIDPTKPNSHCMPGEIYEKARERKLLAQTIESEIICLAGLLGGFPRTRIVNENHRNVISWIYQKRRIARLFNDFDKFRL